MYISIVTIVLLVLFVYFFVRGAWITALILFLFFAWGSSQYATEAREVWQKLQRTEIKL